MTSLALEGVLVGGEVTRTADSRNIWVDSLQPTFICRQFYFNIKPWFTRVPPPDNKYFKHHYYLSCVKLGCFDELMIFYSARHGKVSLTYEHCTSLCLETEYFIAPTFQLNKIVTSLLLSVDYQRIYTPIFQDKQLNIA